MTANGSNAVFFLGSRANYQVLEQPTSYDIENGNASTETIHQNASVEELWPSGQTHKHFDDNCNADGIGWSFSDHNDTVIYERKSACIKRRSKRSSTEALLSDDAKPSVPGLVDDKSEEKPRRISLLSFLTSLARRKRGLDSSQLSYVHQLESVLPTCTYRESCRCLDCQGRYFECGEESEDYSSDEDFAPYHPDIDNHGLPQSDDDDDEVFIDPVSDNDNESTDLLLEDTSQPEGRTASEVLDDIETDKQLQMEVAASTSAMFNLLLYHPFSCSIQ